MKIKKVLSVMIVGAVLSVTATSVFAANTEPKADSKVSLSAPSVSSRADAEKTITEPLASVTPVREGEIGTLSHSLVISETSISAAQGTWERTWSQPANWSYYRFHVKNTTSTSVTVQIQHNGNTQSYNLAANSSTTWTQSAAVAGDHKIVVSTSDGRKFTGDVAVRTADAPF